jgi:hypothetical protein
MAQEHVSKQHLLSPARVLLRHAVRTESEPSAVWHPLPMGRTRLSLRSLLLPAPLDFSRGVFSAANSRSKA